ncbi:hypothetical protein [Salinibacter ruber]|uniref:Uncharacterized protein n=1 Tax=Salinibacter ruber TaxID=146919 RepID=A0A9X2TGD4_9BACT|nr:hypothetical protein [Salinibacter ruber]MCS3661772.1 hypothetical protein [Salinibacter ruber]MCS3711567.1 hypothetical protein [Salinibacter ruber]
MPFREAERELERMETHTPGSGSGAKASVIKRTAFRDALNERESPGERTYHGQGPPDTPSLDEQVIFSK